MIVFLLCAWLSSDDLYLRVEIGLVASSVAALLYFAWSLRDLLKDGAQPDRDSAFEAFIGNPIEG